MIYTDYRSDNHREASGTNVSTDSSAGLTTRLGMSLRSRTHREGYCAEPFLTANWLRQHDDNVMRFNGAQAKGGIARNRYEVKTGIQVEVAKRWNGWAQLSAQGSSSDYRNLTGQVGLAYNW